MNLTKSQSVSTKLALEMRSTAAAKKWTSSELDIAASAWSKRSISSICATCGNGSVDNQQAFYKSIFVNLESFDLERPQGLREFQLLVRLCADILASHNSSENALRLVFIGPSEIADLFSPMSKELGLNSLVEWLRLIVNPLVNSQGIRCSIQHLESAPEDLIEYFSTVCNETASFERAANS